MLKIIGILASALNILADTTQFKGNPYSSKSDLSRDSNHRHIGYISNRNNDDPDFAPIFDSHFLWPDKSGTYPVLFFYTGLYALLPESIYDELLKEIARKGFCVVTSWPAKQGNNFDLWKQQFDWNIANVNDVITDTQNSSRGRTSKVSCDFSKIAVYSHSSASEIIKSFAIDENYGSKISAYYFNDLVMANQTLTDAPVVSNALINIDSSEWCTRCCLKHKSDEGIMESFSGSNVKFADVINGKGHCSLLNYAFVKGCSLIKFCNMYQSTRKEIKSYHNCMAAKAVAFMTDAFFDDYSMRTYYQQIGQWCDSQSQSENSWCEGPYCL